MANDKNNHKMGRPLKLTPEMLEEICSYLEAGNYVETAFKACGVPTSTGYRWLKRGNLETIGPYHDFWEAINKSEARAEARNVAIIELAAKETWTAAAWWLERKFPDRWARKERHELTGEGGKEIKIKVVYE